MGLDVFGREGGAKADCNEGFVCGLCDFGYGGMKRFGEEVRKSEGVAGVTPDAARACGGVGQARRCFVKAEIGPGGEEAEEREYEGSVGTKYDGANELEEEEKRGEVFDTDPDEVAEQGDGMLRYQLFERDKKGRLEGGSAIYDRIAVE